MTQSTTETTVDPANTDSKEPPTSALTIFRRVLLILFLSLLLLISLVLTTSAYFLGTENGLQQLLTQSQRWLPGKLQIDRMEGSLLDTLSLQGVSYQHQDLNIELDKLFLDWEPLAVLSGALHIRTLEIAEPQVELISTPPATTDKPLFPILMPEIRLPVKLKIDDLQLSNLQLQHQMTDPSANQPAINSPPSTLIIDKARLQIHSEQQTLVLDHLHLIAPQGEARISGQLTPAGDYPLQLNTQWKAVLPNQPPLSGEGQVFGDLRSLKLVQKLSGPVSTKATGSLQRLLVKPQGTLRLDDLLLDLELITPQLKGRKLKASLEATGNLQDIELNGFLQTNLPEIGSSDMQVQLRISDQRLSIEKIHLRQSATTAELQLQGEISGAVQNPEFALKGQWSDISYPFQVNTEPVGTKPFQVNSEPVSAKPLLKKANQSRASLSPTKIKDTPLPAEASFRSSKGEFQIEGNLQDYRLGMNGDLTGLRIPSAEWRLTTQGNESELTSVSISADTLDGQLNANGKLSWLSDLYWQMEFEGKHINPGSYWPEWPGNLDFKGHNTGAVTQADKTNNNSPSLQLKTTLDNLSGSLRGEPVKGQARVNLTNEAMTVEALQLNVAGAGLKASGQLGEQLNFDWSLDIPALDQLLTDAQGTLRAKGTLRGPKTGLHLVADLQGQSLQLKDYQAADLKADINMSLSGKQASVIDLQLKKVRYGETLWQQLQLNGRGTPQQHQLELSFNQGPADLALALQGQWSAPRWQGSLSRADLHSPSVGHWKLKKPVTMEATQTNAQIDDLCLLLAPKKTSELCLNGSWSESNGISGELQARQLSIDTLSPWLPAGTTILGQMTAQARFEQQPNKRPHFQAKANLSGAQLSIEDTELKLIAGDINIDLQGDQKQLAVDMQLPLQQPTGLMQARLTVNDLDQQAELQGELNLELSELGVISLFIPQLQAVNGSLTSALAIGGSINSPRLTGALQVNNANAELPALGIKLRDIELSLRDQPNSPRLLLNGSLKSTEGSLILKGELDPLKQTGHLDIAGERFQGVDTAEIQAWFSPDISIVVSPKLIKLDGEIKIPEARITPPKIAASTPISTDVVILDSTRTSATDPPPLKTPLDTRLRLSLGDKVEVKAFGFKGKLQGSVLVEDDGSRATRATGTLKVASGQYRLYGQDINIQRGSLIFSGGPVDNPGLDLRVSRKVDEVTAGARVGGTLKQPRLSLFSVPSMPENNLLSYLLFGRPPGSATTRSEQDLLLRAASSLVMMGGNMLTEKISDSPMIDELGLEAGNSFNETSLFIGKYLSPKLYVKYGVGLLEPTSTFFMRYRLAKQWSLESQTGTKGSGGDIIFTLER
ncbi:translocation/assembly module TamB domain-containing protein [Motiliproteus sp. MSK22-1]|uniref:translocation/assembly module TamB domain-containing protein n=1 Tax=Motiliproteus sp. MSK22-1 TaxID=1897630 RepID=UPI000977EE9B|nr:translocation/assembly module TamB domain-containing protein [Motiliproteus sp. MSK22-1]OMH26266.1 hypothetical protein BGP75_01150 [Motiliproteus sp. MSK22-1]